jgi:phage host-nuclease inhibitor protein Gam
MLSEADEAAVKANADATIKKLRAWREIFTARFLADIEAYHRAELAKQNGKTKTLQHAYGKTALRNVGATVKTADAAAALERALVINPDRFTTRVLNTGEWTNYAKEQLAAGHPLPPGAVETPGHESFSMKVGSGKE